MQATAAAKAMEDGGWVVVKLGVLGRGLGSDLPPAKWLWSFGASFHTDWEGTSSPWRYENTGQNVR